IKKTFRCKVNLGEENSKITICHKPIYHFFVYCLGLGKTAYNKRLPNFIYSLPNHLIYEFVGAYLDGDGSVVDSRSCIVFYSVCRSLLDDLALLLSKYGLVSRFTTTKPRLPGRAVLLKYKELGKEPKTHILHHLVYSGQDSLFFKNNINLRDSRKLFRLNLIKNRFSHRRLRLGRELRKQGDILIDYVKKVEFIKDTKNSYCLDVDCKDLLDRNLLLGEQIINMRCDGDEACLMLLMDGLLNFSNAFLPEHRGGRQDEPLVLSTKIIPNEVDDMVFDMDIAFKYPLELYEAASKFKFPWDVKIDKVGFFLGTEKQYEGYGFTHDTSNINLGNLCSSYKLLPTMEEKVYGQMDLAKRIRSVDEDDVARLVLERHFIRDIKGNLRKFSTQQFRCVNCNEKFRRPPLQGNCTKCNGRLLFTVAEGSVVKYLEPSLSLIEKYKIPAYLKQTVELTKMRIESVFGKEADKQVGLGKWFKS
ncbi:MAG: LAGLIDADG family homing endonuclease, partial [Nanoarchaeota archaeon]